jgi:hypothetical protein
MCVRRARLKGALEGSGGKHAAITLLLTLENDLVKKSASIKGHFNYWHPGELIVVAFGSDLCVGRVDLFIEVVKRFCSTIEALIQPSVCEIAL